MEVYTIGSLSHAKFGRRERGWVYGYRVGFAATRQWLGFLLTVDCATALMLTRLLTMLSWRCLVKAPDRNRIDSVLDRARRHGYCPPDLPTFDELCNTADDELFVRAILLSNHVLHALIPPQSSALQKYNLRHRGHSLQLPSHASRLSDSNFITRMLYKDKY